MTRRMKTPLELLMMVALAAALSACDDGNGGTDAGPPDEEDAGGGDEDAGGGDEDAGGGDEDAGGTITNSVTVEDPQTLTDLSTVVTIPQAVSDGPGFVVIHEDDAGSPGAVIGHTAVNNGTNTDVAVALDRPAEDGETLHAMLHIDAGTIGTYEFPGPDGPAMADGAVVNEPFVVMVTDGIPAVRLTISNVGITSWQVDSVEPAGFAGSVVGAGAEDPTLTLQIGWRYEVNNTVPATHPFEITGTGGTTVLLSQSGVGTLESDGSIDWTEAGDSVLFTASTSLSAAATEYRCAIHTGEMRGDLAFE